jgi:hypothetical protein
VSNYSEDVAGVRRLGRAVITNALKDLGLGDEGESHDVKKWVRSSNFNRWCEYLNWGDWVADVFDQVDEIDGPTRAEITRQCLRMMKFVSSN